jgi:hypothetical protein
MIGALEDIMSGKAKYDNSSDKRISEFLERHKLIDVRSLKPRQKRQLKRITRQP